jgi:hypothetical protein
MNIKTKVLLGDVANNIYEKSLRSAKNQQT